MSAMRLMSAAAVLCITLAACSGDSDDRWRGPDGQRVPNGRTRVDGEFPLTIDVKSGPEHCDWTDVRFLDVVWPLGEVVTGYSAAVRQYVWDPGGAHGFDLRGTPERDAVPPADAVDTGFRRDAVELWIADSDADRYVYLRQSDGSFERWPRSEQLNGCT
jgi:hypothetical protein